MQLKQRAMALGVAFVSISACTTYPSQGMTRAALRGDNQTQQEFLADDSACRQYATAQTGFNPGEQAREDQIITTAVGTVLGVVGGAVIGGAFGAPAHGTAIGATTGLSSGAAAGVGAGGTTYAAGVQTWQVNYDACMHNEGHIVATPGGGLVIQHPDSRL